MDIATVAKLSALPASTLRFYEEKGLIQSIGRRGGRRIFPPDVMDRLALIALGRTTGFSLDEIASVFSMDGGKLNIDRKKLLVRADHLEDTIKQLAAMKSYLRHVAACPSANHLDCPSFKRLLLAAATGELACSGGDKKHD